MTLTNITKISGKGFKILQKHDKGKLLDKYTIHKVNGGIFGDISPKKNKVDINTTRNKPYSPPLNELKLFVDLIKDLKMDYSFKKL
jgi:hypothetical protein